MATGRTPQAPTHQYDGMTLAAVIVQLDKDFPGEGEMTIDAVLWGKLLILAKSDLAAAPNTFKVKNPAENLE